MRHYTYWHKQGYSWELDKMTEDELIMLYLFKQLTNQYISAYLFFKFIDATTDITYLGEKMYEK